MKIKALIFLLFLIIIPPATGQSHLIEGKVYDKQTREVLPFTNISISGTQIRTVANRNGEFILKVPHQHVNDTIKVSHIGYEIRKIKIRHNESSYLKIYLTPSTKKLKDLVIKPKEAVKIVREAIAKIPQNYSNSSVLMDGYYRELVRENHKYVKLSEASCVYRYAAYGTDYAKDSARQSFRDFRTYSEGMPFFRYNPITRVDDQVMIVEARSSNNMRLERIDFNVAGGPISITRSDVVKYQDKFLDGQKTKYYKYDLIGQTTLNNNLVYVITFTPKVRTALKAQYSGKIYIDKETKSFVKLVFNIKKGRNGALTRGYYSYRQKVPTKKNPNKMKVIRDRMDGINETVEVDYRYYQGRTYLSRIRKESSYNFFNKKDNIHIPYQTIQEVIFDRIQSPGVGTFPADSVFKNTIANHLFSFPLDYNDAYWKNYTFLKRASEERDIAIDMGAKQSLADQFKFKHIKDESMVPPIADTVVDNDTIHNTIRTDYYSWLENPNDETVTDYLKAENAYTNNYMIPHRKTVRYLFNEMVARTQDRPTKSLPVKHNRYFYYSKYRPGDEYRIVYRRKDSKNAHEEVIFNVNEMAENLDYYSFGSYTISPNDRIAGYTESTAGDLEYTLKFKDLDNHKLLNDSLDNVWRYVWLDDETILYASKDEISSTYKLFEHTLGKSKQSDRIIYHEKNDQFSMGLQKSKSGKYIFLIVGGYDEKEIRYLNVENPENGFQVFFQRSQGKLPLIDHVDGHFYILLNKNTSDYGLYRTSEEMIEPTNWEELIEPNSENQLVRFEAFDDFIAIEEKKSVQDRIRILNLETREAYYLEFKDEIHNVHLSYTRNNDPNTDRLYFNQAPLTEPYTLFSYNVKTQKTNKVSETAVINGYNPKLYRSERIWIDARDGEKVPVTLIYNKKLRSKEGNPMLLRGYGMYGLSNELSVNKQNLSLLDRGYILAQVHVRGGGELGNRWHEEGKMLKKKNSFNDFIDCAEGLIKLGYTQKGNIIAEGASAGGLLVGAVVNERPDLFKAAILSVPAVDILNSLFNESVAISKHHYRELGDPSSKVKFDYIRSYSPYDNVRTQAYCPMLFLTGLNDDIIPYWEATKMVAKLRQHKTDSNPLLLKVDMNSGHNGGSGRYSGTKETAFKYAFILSLEK